MYPLVPDAVGRALGICLVQVDGLLLDREYLFLEQQLVLLQGIGIQVLRAFRCQYVISKRLIDLRQAKRRLRRNLGHPVPGGVGVCRDDVLHQGPLELHALRERLRELHHLESLAYRFGEPNRRFRGQEACAVRALSAGARIHVDDVAQACRHFGAVALAFSDLEQPVASFDGL